MMVPLKTKKSPIEAEPHLINIFPYKKYFLEISFFVFRGHKYFFVVTNIFSCPEKFYLSGKVKKIGDIR